MYITLEYELVIYAKCEENMQSKGREYMENEYQNKLKIEKENVCKAKSKIKMQMRNNTIILVF